MSHIKSDKFVALLRDFPFTSVLSTIALPIYHKGNRPNMCLITFFLSGIFGNFYRTRNGEL